MSWELEFGNREMVSPKYLFCISRGYLTHLDDRDWPQEVSISPWKE